MGRSEWVLVPRVPTEEMETAAEDDYEGSGTPFPNWKVAYTEMLAAAPPPPAEQAAPINPAPAYGKSIGGEQASGDLPELPEAATWCEQSSLDWFIAGRGYVISCAQKTAAWDGDPAGLYTDDQMCAYAIAALSQRPVVDEAMVDRAAFSYYASDTFPAGAKPWEDVRHHQRITAALTAALEQTP